MFILHTILSSLTPLGEAATVHALFKDNSFDRVCQNIKDMVELKKKNNSDIKNTKEEIKKAFNKHKI